MPEGEARARPGSVLFCCDHNAVRSPMAEGLMKKRHGHAIYVQSAGVVSDLEIDGFAIAVCAEIGVELSRHRARSFGEMKALGDDLEGFDLIVALSPASRDMAAELARHAHIDVEFWDVGDPTGQGEGARRQARPLPPHPRRHRRAARGAVRVGGRLLAGPGRGEGARSGAAPNVRPPGGGPAGTR